MCLCIYITFLIVGYENINLDATLRRFYKDPPPPFWHRANVFVDLFIHAILKITYGSTSPSVQK